MRIAATLAFVVAMLSGCEILTAQDAEPDYPRSFPKLAETSPDCENIGGTYSNHGVQHSPVSGLETWATFTRDALKLTQPFDESEPIRLSLHVQHTASFFGLTRSLALRITGVSGQDWNSPAGKSTCTNGGLVYIIDEIGGFSPIGYGVSNNQLKVGIAVDGSLIVTRYHQDAGFFAAIPYRSSANLYYYRFPPAQERP